MRLSQLLLCSTSACTIALLVPPALATPEPSVVPTAWELKCEPVQPARISIGGKTYWYMLYTITNNSGKDVDYFPEIVRVSEIESELADDQVAGRAEAPKVIVDPSILGVDSTVYQAIAKRHAHSHPFLITPVNAIGRLLQGRDNARTSVAVFPDLDPRVARFTIYFGGLSGEQVAKPNPLFDPRKPESDDNPRFFVIRKTLAIPYTLPGDAGTRRAAIPVLGRMTWVMR